MICGLCRCRKNSVDRSPNVGEANGKCKWQARVQGCKGMELKMEIAISFKTQSLACNMTPLLGDIGSSSNMVLGFLMIRSQERVVDLNHPKS